VSASLECTPNIATIAAGTLVTTQADKPSGNVVQHAVRWLAASHLEVSVVRVRSHYRDQGTGSLVATIDIPFRGANNIGVKFRADARSSLGVRLDVQATTSAWILKVVFWWKLRASG